MTIKITTLTEFDVIIELPEFFSLIERKENIIHKKLTIEQINKIYMEFNSMSKDLELFLGKVNFDNVKKHIISNGKTQNIILDFIKNNPIFTIENIVSGTTLRKSQVTNVLSNLVKKGLVVRTSLGRYETRPSQVVEI